VRVTFPQASRLANPKGAAPGEFHVSRLDPQRA
jgi:hypothetical protein